MTGADEREQPRETAPPKTDSGTSAIPPVGAGGLVEAAGVSPPDQAEPTAVTSEVVGAPGERARTKVKAGPVVLLILILLAVLVGVVWWLSGDL